MDGSQWCLVVGALIFFLFFFLWSNEQSTKLKRLTAANEAYKASLAKLKTDPTNADLKEATLALGRKYSAMSREQKAATIYDEMALMNDISAATAAATSSTAASSATVEERIKQLDALREKGIVTEQEYQDRRKAILEQL